jgi:hypothetical protein
VSGQALAPVGRAEYVASPPGRLLVGRDGMFIINPHRARQLFRLSAEFGKDLVPVAILAKNMSVLSVTGRGGLAFHRARAWQQSACLGAAWQRQPASADHEPEGTRPY